MAFAYSEEKNEHIRYRNSFTEMIKKRSPFSAVENRDYSRAFDRTFFQVPEPRYCFDAGLCEGRQEDTVFLTHTHDDHAADIEFLAGKSSSVDMYVPQAAEKYVNTYIRAKRELNHITKFDPALATEFRMHSVKGDDQITFGKKRNYRASVTTPRRSMRQGW